MKILIIRLSSIGDCVLASPVLEALRERYPDAHITWAVQAKSAPVVQGLPGLTETLLWEKRNNSYWRSLLPILKKVRREKFDVALDLQGIDKAGIVALASGAQRRITGSSSHRLAKWSSNERVPESGLLHARLFYLRRAAALDIAPNAAERFFPHLPLTAEHRNFARQFLQQGEVESSHRLVGLNLGASGPKKRWPATWFAQLAQRVLSADAKARIIVFGARADLPLWQSFQQELNQANSAVQESRILNGVGTLNLLQMAAMAERCSAFVTADTGPMHIAAAVGAPVLALCGPVNVQRTGPVRNPDGAPIRILDARDITGSWPAPMSVLDVDRVFDEVTQLIEESETFNEQSDKLSRALGA